MSCVEQHTQNVEQSKTRAEFDLKPEVKVAGVAGVAKDSNVIQMHLRDCHAEPKVRRPERRFANRAIYRHRYLAKAATFNQNRVKRGETPLHKPRQIDT